MTPEDRGVILTLDTAEERVRFARMLDDVDRNIAESIRLEELRYTTIGEGRR